jgi:O-antigen ligase
MKKNLLQIQKQETKIFRFILVATCAITLYFNPALDDPFNSPKFWLLLLTAGWILGHLLFVIKNFRTFEQTLKIYIAVVVVFVFCLLFSSLLSENTYNAFIGEYFRKLGFLTYLSLAIFTIAAALFTNILEIKKVYKYTAITGAVVSGYGLLQNLGKDFIEWVNPYNSVISTLGNPNFAAASMAIFFAFCFGAILNTGVPVKIRLFNLALAPFILYVIYLSNSRQGLLSSLFAATVILVPKIYHIKKFLGHFFTISVAILGVLIMLAFLRVGPLVELIYKQSISVRGHYWRAAINMITENPILGVGVDNYGTYFKQFRDPLYSLTYGFQITSSNAHSVPLQLTATSGLPTGLIYLLWILTISIVGIKGVILFSGRDKNFFTTIFAAWIAYLSQSFISIDSLGIAIWGWTLGGMLIGAYACEKKSRVNQVKLSSEFPSKSRKVAGVFISNPLQVVFSAIITLGSILFVSSLYQGESISIRAKLLMQNESNLGTQQILEQVELAVKTPFMDNNNKIGLAYMLSNAGFRAESEQMLSKVLKDEQNSLDGLTLQAYNKEFLNKIPEAINLRKSIMILDPWNSENLLQLGRNYKATSDSSAAAEVLLKISAFDTVSPESKLAVSELKNG